MDNLIKTITIEEFDQEAIKVGQFITFRNVYQVPLGGIRLGNNINGIITYVYPEAISVYTSSHDKIRISLESIKNGQKEILGLLDSAVIEEEGQEPENPPVVEGDGTEGGTTEGGNGDDNGVDNGTEGTEGTEDGTEGDITDGGTTEGDTTEGGDNTNENGDSVVPEDYNTPNAEELGEDTSNGDGNIETGETEQSETGETGGDDSNSTW